MILVSIVVPVYNVEKYLATCLNSILQCGLKDDEMQILIVDDETPDNSMAIANDFASRHSFIKIISQKNKGLGGARNTGITHAEGQYLMFLDSDDWILPGVLPDLARYALEKNLDVLEFACQGIMPDGSISYHYHFDSAGQVLDGVSHYQKKQINNSACNKLYSSKFLTENQLYFLERIFIEDFEFNNRVFLTAKRVEATPKLLGQYLQSPDSITRNSNPQKRAKMFGDILIVLRKTNELYQTFGETSAAHQHFFLERMGFIVTTFFYQFFKDKAPVSDATKAHKQMKSEGLYFVNYPLNDGRKNLFRLVLLRNFFLFKLAMFFRNAL